MKVVYKALSFIVGASAVIAVGLAFFVRKVDPELGVIRDGLGRVLVEPQPWAAFFLTQEAVWAGLGWHLLDSVLFFGGTGLAVWLFSLSE